MAQSNYCPHCMTTFLSDEEGCPNLGCARLRPETGWAVVLGEGDVLDRHYRIDRALAVGGAGLCYLAREVDDAGEPKPPELAIKVLYAQRDSGPFLRRLANEAQILQDLDHPNIVECRGFVHRVGHAPYLVTLFERGGSLADHVEEHGPLPAVSAAGILVQVLMALCVAHDRGIVHRDLKPQNVLLRERVEPEEIPMVRVVDFGIAKLSGGAGVGLTTVGSFVGTPEYAAPEQFSGGLATPATDVYAVGALLHYLLLGRPPIRFSHRMDIAHSYEEMRTQIPPQLPRDLGPDDEVRGLQRVLDQTMLPDPAARATARRVIDALSQLPGVEPSLRALPPVPPPSVRSPAVVSAPPPTLGGGEASETIVAWMGTDARETVLETQAPLDPVPLHEAPQPVQEAPQALGLDDLFSFSEPAPPPPAPSPPPLAFAPPAPAVRPEPIAPPVSWEPISPRSLPKPLPDRAKPLLELLGNVSRADRGPVVARLGGLAESDLKASVRGLSVAGTTGQRRGAVLAIAALERREWLDIALKLRADRDPSVGQCSEEVLRSFGVEER